MISELLAALIANERASVARLQLGDLGLGFGILLIVLALFTGLLGLDFVQRLVLVIL